MQIHTVPDCVGKRCEIYRLGLKKEAATPHPGAIARHRAAHGPGALFRSQARRAGGTNTQSRNR